MSQQVKITETILRDAHQCLIATRMRTEDMLPICEKLDAVGFWALEVWGGATFDSCLRFLKEDPWQRLRDLRQAMPNTQLSMLLRGQNIVGYRHYADDVVRLFVERAAKNGIDVFRVFDALNDIRNLEVAIDEVKKQNKHAQGAICYTTSPVHNTKQFLEMAKQLEDMGCDSLAIKDMAGLLTPQAIDALMPELQKDITIPIHLHTHATSGLASICHYWAVAKGCRHIDTALSPFSGGASHPCTESMIAAFQNTPQDTGLDLNLLAEIADYFKTVRQRYHQFESAHTGIDPRVQLYQVPGGMISNLSNQLKEQNALDKLPEVHLEIPKVRKDLGYPPLVTPSSQIVGTQAVLNVLTGERYKTITNEVKLYCQGKYGKPPGEVDANLRKAAIGNADLIDVRPASLLPNELDKTRKAVGSLAQSDEDVLSYAIFPDIAKTFFEERASGEFKPEPLQARSSNETLNAMRKFQVSVHGEDYEIELTGSGSSSDNQRPIYLTVDGMPEEILVTSLDAEGDPSAQQAANVRAKPSQPGDVAVSMPSTIIDVMVTVGQTVKKGEPLLVAEAMKMQTEIQAPIDGKVTSLNVTKGESVTPDEVLVEIS